RIVYFDDPQIEVKRKPEPGHEGVEISLHRAGSGEAAWRLTLQLSNIARDGAVDGKVDAIAIAWVVGASERLQITIAPLASRPDLTERVITPESSYVVMSPHLAAIVARAQSQVYDTLAGPNFTRAIRDGS